LDLWAYQRGVTLDFSRPGKPTDNAFIEAFNSRFRAECLRKFGGLAQRAIGQQTPVMLLNQNGAASPPP